jgi:urease beta subunit
MSATIEINEAIVADYIRAQVAGVERELPEITGIRISIGSYSTKHCVSLSGFVQIKGVKTHKVFSGPTIAAAVQEARTFLSL